MGCIYYHLTTYENSMKPSFLNSTLSLAFIICVVSTVAMIFMHITPDAVLFGVISGVVGAYVGSRVPTTLPEQPTQTYGTDTEQNN